MLKVQIDDNSGFCFGVVYAIEMAEDYLDQFGSLYCLGDIVHNDEEVARLKAKGLKIINHADLAQIQEAAVLIRAHGEPPETYKLALQNKIELIDASCPVVLKLQNRVRKAFDDDAQIIIFGKPGHAEVVGLLGQTQNKAIVVTTVEDLDKIDFNQKIQFFSQTTKSTDKFYELRDEIQRRALEAKANDTICRQVSNREPQLKVFAAKFDVIVFVAGEKSSNGKVLFNACQSANPRCYFISNAKELKPEWFAGVESVGVCGATSTPMWLMEEVKQAIEKIGVAA